MRHAWCAAVVAACAILAPVCAESPAQPGTVVHGAGETRADPVVHPPFPDAIVPDSPNAAARYLWLFERFDARFTPLLARLDLDSVSFEFRPDAAGSGTVADLRALLVEQREWILALIEASKVEDFRLHYADDWNAELADDDPRTNLIGQSMRAVRVLLADALRLWQDGEPGDAGKRIAAACVLSWRLASPPSPALNQLGAHSLLAAAMRTLALLLAEGQPALPEQQGLELLEVFERMDPKDPVNLRKGWQSNQMHVRAFVEGQLAGGEVGDQLLETLVMSRTLNAGISGIFSSLTKDGNDEPPTEQELIDLATRITEEVEGLSHQRLVDQLKKIDDLAARIEEAWERKDARKKLKALEEECDRDETGLTTLVIMSPRSTQRQWREGVEQLSKIQARLRERLPKRGD